MEELLLLICGTSFYSSSFFITKQTLFGLFKKRLTEADIVTISEKVVNGIHGIVSVYIGATISSQCYDDILYSSSWLTNAFTWFALPYFIYDLVVMYLGHLLTFPDVQDMTFLDRIQHFVLHNKLITVHHLVLPVIFFPVIVFLRRGMGDFFVGVFFQIEISLPFIAARSIMVQLQMKHTVLYVVVGIVMIITFFVSRILVFPYLYWRYAVYKNISTWRVPFFIPLKCSTGCALILCLQLYWMSKMIKGAMKLLYKLRSGKRPSTEQTNCDRFATEKMS
ncbi:LOW QUALITY PROTEIN: TLC domain-containing protein 3A-like [Pecten maximus]|uniref:LOW QUALITY PROTEIN: TLC domain-containing protein 3A-like n=1 Tax=Pecten maximus TaxID=6579 RepID=UPI001458E45B|nr:LOW QUALITY PROTEIN: TLC domain-containing protein 3A-like [Pecten maximus]